MLLDVLPVLRGDKNKIEFSFSFAPGDTADIQDYFPDIEFYEQAQVTGCVISSADCMHLHEDVALKYRTGCARCTETVERDIELKVDADIADASVSEDNDDYIFIKDKKLDVLTPVIDEILLNLPRKTLCSEDCKGICQGCGKNLNKESCTCVKEKGDPRLAILKTLYKK